MIPRLFILLIGLLRLGGQTQLSGNEIFKNVEAGLSGMLDYTVDLDVTTNVDRMNVPRMHVRMYYKQPDKFHFESDGFALLPREGLAFSASRMLSRFSVEDVEEEMSGNEKQFKLLLRPRDTRVRATQLILYIDAAYWKPRTIVSSLFDGRTMTASFRYEKQGSYLMPSSLSVEFAAPPADTTDQTLGMEVAPLQRPQMPRSGTITVRYSSYRINTGLSDDIFDKK